MRKPAVASIFMGWRLSLDGEEVIVRGVLGRATFIFPSKACLMQELGTYGIPITVLEQANSLKGTSKNKGLTYDNTEAKPTPPIPIRASKPVIQSHWSQSHLISHVLLGHE